jgi:hypothetical protein
MISEILKFVHVVSGAIAIGAGAWMLFGALEGKLFKKWAVIFLKCAVVASATGLLFPSHYFLPTHWVAMSAVYVSVVAVLAWRIYGLAGIWALLFALSTMLVWCLDVLVVIAHVFVMLIPTQPKLFLIIMESVVILLFAGFGLFIVKRYRYSQVEPMVRNR